MKTNRPMTFSEIDKSLPFFAYGIFKPGEIGFLAIKRYVEKVEPLSIGGGLFVRGGMLLYSAESEGGADGYLLYFKKGKEDAAYRYINNIEPMVQYHWEEKSRGKKIFNMLYGKVEKDDNGHTEYKYNIEESDWQGTWEDIFFKDALDLLNNKLVKDNSFNYEFLNYQMRYLLLWTVIERFLILRYGESNRDNLANNVFFQNALKKFGPEEERKILGFNIDPVKYSPIRISKKDALNKNYHYEVMYYYQMRCNITHRGKGINKDIEALRLSLEELLNIIGEVIKKTKEECKEDEKRYGGKTDK